MKTINRIPIYIGVILAAIGCSPTEGIEAMKEGEEYVLLRTYRLEVDSAEYEYPAYKAYFEFDAREIVFVRDSRVLSIYANGRRVERRVMLPQQHTSKFPTLNEPLWGATRLSLERDWRGDLTIMLMNDVMADVSMFEIHLLRSTAPKRPYMSYSYFDPESPEFTRDTAETARRYGIVFRETAEWEAIRQAKGITD